MTRPSNETLLAFVNETLGQEERARVVRELKADPELAKELERAAAGLEALEALHSAPAPGRSGLASWWVGVAAGTTLALAVPTTLYFADRPSRASSELIETPPTASAEFVLILRGSWSDDSRLETEEILKREEELAAWANALETSGIVVSVSDLAVERGVRVGPDGPASALRDDYVAGVITLRCDHVDEVMAIARSSPHLARGGSVTVRRVGVAPQATSLLGEPLYARADSTGEVAAADAALARAPEDVELLLAAGRARWSSWQYRPAVTLYTRAIEVAPEDWRPYTDRGIRRVALRQFDGAITDLERARELAPLNYDVSYYLGFVYFLEGRFEDAANEYMRCFGLADNPQSKAAQAYNFRSCSQIADDIGWRVAITDWAIRALRRAGRNDEAMELLSTIRPGMPVEAYLAYYHTLLFYQGHMTAEELLSVDDNDPYDVETVGYGVANWYLVEGDTERSVEILEEIAVSPRWPAYGRIAAEADLIRLGFQ